MLKREGRGWAGLEWVARGGRMGSRWVLTAEMEMVARANGSPMMLPTSMPRRLFCLLYSILRSDGEWSEP